MCQFRTKKCVRMLLVNGLCPEPFGELMCSPDSKPQERGGDRKEERIESGSIGDTKNVGVIAVTRMLMVVVVVVVVVVT